MLWERDTAGRGHCYQGTLLAVLTSPNNTCTHLCVMEVHRVGVMSVPTCSYVLYGYHGGVGNVWVNTGLYITG